MRKLTILFCLVISVLFSSCSALTKNITESLTASLMQQEDVILVKDGAPSFLLLIEGLIYNDPDNKDLLSAGIQMFSAYGGIFVTETGRKELFNKKTKKWAIDLLLTYPKFKKYYTMSSEDKAQKDAAFEDFLKSIKKKDVPYVFWASYSWALDIMAHLDSPVSFIELPIPRAIIQRVYELEDTFYYGAPHLFFGIIYGAYPKMYGGDPEKAKQEFDRALEISQGKLYMVKLMYADFYYKPLMDRENYVKIVQEVIDGDIEEAPENRLLNIMAQKQARAMLEAADEFFMDDFDFE